MPELDLYVIAEAKPKKDTSAAKKTLAIKQAVQQTPYDFQDIRRSEEPAIFL